MNIPGLPDSMFAQQTWSNAQLEQLSLLMAAASQMSGSSLPLPGMPTPNTGAADLNQSLSTMASHLFSTKSVDVNSAGLTAQTVNNMNFPTPDGKSALRYPEPDVKSLLYDPAVGYRFDPSTGLHYDANSGLFINIKLEILLRYDKLTNMYERAGSTVDITAPVLVRDFAELMGYDTAPPAAADPPPASPRVCPFPPDMPEEKQRSPGYVEMSISPKSPGQQRRSLSPKMDTGLRPKYSPKYSPSPPREIIASPVREGSRSKRDHSPSPKSGRSSNRRWDARPKEGPPRKDSRSPPRKSRSRSRDRGRPEDEKFQKTLDSVIRIYRRNLKNPDNFYGKLLSPSSSLTKSNMEYIMVTPLPPKGDREWTDLEILFKGILKANGIPFGNVKVFPANGNTPCDVCFIRFKRPLDASRWFLLHKGVLDLANPDGTKRSSYLYFSTYYWKCVNCQYFNFPLRVFCYGCYLPQTITKEMGVAPITLGNAGDCKYVGLKKLDFHLSSTEEVINSLPTLNGFGIKTCEFMTESTGLPLGLCVFEMRSRDAANKFYKGLQKMNLNPAYLCIINRISLSNNPYRMREGTCDQMTQTVDTNVKSLGDYILRNWPVDIPEPDQKGTQTILAYKHLNSKAQK